MPEIRERRPAIPLPWIICIFALWVLVLGETALLLLLLRGLGVLKQQLQSLPPLPLVAQTDQGGLAVGVMAPSFVAHDALGQQTHLEASDGRERLLVFLKPGCPACAEAIRLVNELVAQEDSVSVLLFGLADQEANQEYIAASKTSLSLLTPEDPASCQKLYDIRAVPFAFFIDVERVIRAAGVLSHPRQLEHLLSQSRTRVSSLL